MKRTGVARNPFRKGEELGPKINEQRPQVQRNPDLVRSLFRRHLSLEYEIGENWLLYFVPSVTVGSGNTEFGSLVRYSIFAGLSFTF